MNVFAVRFVLDWKILLMALYHFHAKMIGRSSGKSAIAAAAYRSASALTRECLDEQTGVFFGETFDYRKKNGVVFSHIFAPEGSPDWSKDRQKLWNYVEDFEKRSNAQFARDLDIALQCELTLDENIDVLKQFVHDNFVRHGMIADVNVHFDNKNNPHAHIMLTTRALEEKNNGLFDFKETKNREWGTKTTLNLWRMSWANLVNACFLRHGIDKTITHESYADRGLEWINPTVHEGRAHHAQAINGVSIVLDRIQDNALTIEKNIEHLENFPLKVVKSLAEKIPVFSLQELEKSIDKTLHQMAARSIEEEEKFSKIHLLIKKNLPAMVEALVRSKELSMICPSNVRGEALYTTPETQEREAKFFEHVQVLSSRMTHCIISEESKPSLYDRILHRLSGKKNPLKLSDEQSDALRHLLEGPDLSVLVGRPGTGKSTVMRQLVEQYEKQGFHVIGAAYSAEAAAQLRDSSSMETHTIAKWLYDWEKREALGQDARGARLLLPTLGKNNIFVIDESSMVDIVAMESMLAHAAKAGAKVILIGDTNQLSALGQGGSLDKTLDLLPHASLKTIYRQRHEADRTINHLLAEHRVGDAIELLDKGGKLFFFDRANDTQGALVDAYVKDAVDHRHDTRIIIATTNAQVQDLNRLVRGRLLASGSLHSEKWLEGNQALASVGGMKIAIGERLMALKNDRRFGIRNGMVGVVKAIVDDGKLLMDWNGEGNGWLDTQKYSHITYGYATTAHKSQGRTYDRVFLLIGSGINYASFNVMATRHREALYCFVNLESGYHNTQSKNPELLDRESQKNTLLHWAESLPRHRWAKDFEHYDTSVHKEILEGYKNARTKSAELASTINADIARNVCRSFGQHPLFPSWKSAADERCVFAEAMLEDWSKYQIYSPSGFMRKETVRHHARLGSEAGALRKMPEPSSSIRKDYDALQATAHQYDSATAPERKKIYAALVVDRGHAMLERHSLNQAAWTEALKESLLAKDTSYQKSDEFRVNQWLIEDFKVRLSKIFSPPSEKVLEAWNALVEDHGPIGASEKVRDNPQVLGSLQGVGMGNIPLSDKRAVALALISDLPDHCLNYHRCHSASDSLSDAMAEANAQYFGSKQTASLLEKECLSEEQVAWVRETIGSLEKSLGNGQEAQASASSNITSSLIPKEEEWQKKTDTQDKKFVLSKPRSLDDIHEKLSENIEKLAAELLPKWMHKPIEQSAHAIVCGSLHLQTTGDKKGLWYRFSTGEGGNLLSLIEKSEGLNRIHDAIVWAEQWLGFSRQGHAFLAPDHALLHTKAEESLNLASSASKEKAHWKPVMPIPESVGDFDPTKNLTFIFEDRKKSLEDCYLYRDEHQRRCGYVIRMVDQESLKKEMLPVVYAESSHGRQGWKILGFGENRPLYGAHLLPQSPNKPVLIVEGEKTAKEASSIFPEFVVLTWMGGSHAVSKSQWSVLSGRDVTIWPDNDKPGKEAAKHISDLLRDLSASRVGVVDLKALSLPEAWDLADSLPDHLHPFHATSALWNTARHACLKERLLKEYREMRTAQMRESDRHTDYKGIVDYLAKQEKNMHALSIEHSLLEKKLEAGDVVHPQEYFFLSRQAEAMAVVPAKDSMKSWELSSDHQHDLKDYLEHRHPHLRGEESAHVSLLAMKHGSLIVESWHGHASLDHEHLKAMQAMVSMKFCRILMDEQARGQHSFDDPHLIERSSNLCRRELQNDMHHFEHHQQLQQSAVQTRQLEHDH
jgi:Ti-type conjugative transfer relaxase TraA